MWRPIFISWLNVGRWPPADVLRHQGIPRAAIALLKVLSRAHSRTVQVLLLPCRVNHNVLHMVDQLVFARASPIAVVEVENGQETRNPAPTTTARASLITKNSNISVLYISLFLRVLGWWVGMFLYTRVQTHKLLGYWM